MDGFARFRAARESHLDRSPLETRDRNEENSFHMRRTAEWASGSEMERLAARQVLVGGQAVSCMQRCEMTDRSARSADYHSSRVLDSGIKFQKRRKRK